MSAGGATREASSSGDERRRGGAAAGGTMADGSEDRRRDVRRQNRRDVRGHRPADQRNLRPTPNVKRATFVWLSSHFDFARLLRRRNPLFHERIPVVTVRALPEQLRAA